MKDIDRIASLAMLSPTDDEKGKMIEYMEHAIEKVNILCDFGKINIPETTNSASFNIAYREDIVTNERNTETQHIAVPKVIEKESI